MIPLAGYRKDQPSGRRAAARSLSRKDLNISELFDPLTIIKAWESKRIWKRRTAR
jgi:hypothetical protein